MANWTRSNHRRRSTSIGQHEHRSANCFWQSAHSKSCWAKSQVAGSQQSTERFVSDWIGHQASRRQCWASKSRPSIFSSQNSSPHSGLWLKSLSSTSGSDSNTSSPDSNSSVERRISKIRRIGCVSVGWFGDSSSRTWIFRRFRFRHKGSRGASDLGLARFTRRFW